MSFPDVSDLVATTLENRAPEVADNVSKNNALWAYMKANGNVKTFDGGRLIYEPLSFAANANGGWYSGYDTLSVAAQDVISAAEFSIKQYAVPVVVSGLELLQNTGKSQILDLLESRIEVAESTMINDMTTAVMGDGTAFGGKCFVGLDAAVAVTPTSGTYGGINRAAWSFWQNQTQTDTACTTATIQPSMNKLWAKLVRGKDRPDLIVADSITWGLYLGSLQLLQRFTTDQRAKLGFPSMAFMGDCDVILDNAITTKTMAFLNTKYFKVKMHKDRNFVPLSPDRRSPINQDATVSIMAAAGAITCSNANLQGRLTCSGGST